MIQIAGGILLAFFALAMLPYILLGIFYAVAVPTILIAKLFELMPNERKK